MKITQVTAHLIEAPEFNNISCNINSPFLRIQLADNLLWLEGFDRSLDPKAVYSTKALNQLEEAFKQQITVIHEQLELF